MRFFSSVAGLRCYLGLVRFEQGNPSLEADLSPPQRASERSQVGFVPTMGALHVGHVSLMQRARQENSIVVVSIFVNPLQFGPSEDLHRYPRSLDRDCQLCAEAGVDVVFAPPPEALGIESTAELPLTQVVPPASMLSVMCGAFRPGHFQGVTTIVTKLLHLVQPERAYFGQKDAQQLAIIRRMVRDLDFPTEIVACPTVREANGLACSSRNQYLSPEQREQAAIIYQSLQQAEHTFRAGERFAPTLVGIVKDELASVPQLQPEYVDLVDPVTLSRVEYVEEQGLLAIATRLGSTRLIDNCLLRQRLPIVAIDGPAGAGKSTVARLVAQALGLLYLDTGAMYRSVTWLVLQAGIAVTDQPAIAELVSRCTLELRPEASGTQIWVNGQNVTQAIRSPEVTAQVSAISAQPAVRRALVQQQRRYGRRGGIVIEGRDIGTYVFPDAELKIFLTASVQERARRRQLDLYDQGHSQISLDELEQAMSERDQKDSTRTLAPLYKAADAIELPTDGLSISEVVDRIVKLYEA